MLETPRQPSNELSPEVATLLQTLGQPKDKDITKSTPELIELDTDDQLTGNTSHEKDTRDDSVHGLVTTGNVTESSEDSATELLNELNLDVTSIKPAKTQINDHTVNLEDQLCEINDNTSNPPERKNTPECTPRTQTVVTGNVKVPQNEMIDLPVEENVNPVIPDDGTANVNVNVRKLKMVKKQQPLKRN